MVFMLVVHMYGLCNRIQTMHRDLENKQKPFRVLPERQPRQQQYEFDAEGVPTNHVIRFKFLVFSGLSRIFFWSREHTGSGVPASGRTGLAAF